MQCEWGGIINRINVSGKSMHRTEEFESLVGWLLVVHILLRTDSYVRRIFHGWILPLSLRDFAGPFYFATMCWTDHCIPERREDKQQCFPN